MDNNIARLLALEEDRQSNTISLIPSENYASHAVRELAGSVLMNKYSEGYAGRRYYQGNAYIDSIEMLAQEKAKALFGVPHANVQPYSGSPANSAVLFALVNPGDTIIGLELSSGGHLTHGHPKITFSGKYFNSVQFSIAESYIKMRSDIDKGILSNIELYPLIDYTSLAKLVKLNNPKLIIIGSTAYPHIIDWQKIGEIADSVGAYFVADISHVAGLIVGGVYPSPKDYADVIVTTTHKSLRGPRGAIIMATNKGLKKDMDLCQKLDRGVFPGLQGGPHNNTTAAIAQCLFEASAPAFKKYSQKVVDNAQALAKTLKRGTKRVGQGGNVQGLRLVGGGTESHLILVDLTPMGLSGNVVAEALEVSGIVVNRNSVPGDKTPFYPSGIRVGTPAVTTRGMGEKELLEIGEYILEVVDFVKNEKLPENPKERVQFITDFKKRLKTANTLLDINNKVRLLRTKYPVVK